MEEHMATTAQAVTTKNQEAIRLRAEVQTLTGEVQQLRKQLAEKSGTLAVLTEKRRVLAEEIADGKPHKPATLAALHDDIAAAELPVSALQRRTTEKEGQLTQTKSVLEALDREIAAEARAAAYQARFSELKTELIASGAVIGEALRRFIEEELPRFDAARDALTLEIVGGRYAEQTTPEGREARELIRSVMESWRSPDGLAIRRKLLRADRPWTPRGDIRLELENLNPPKR